MDLPIDLFAVAVLAVISRSGDYDDPGIRNPSDSLTERIGGVGLDCRRSDTQVDDSNAVHRVICHHPVESCQKG